MNRLPDAFREGVGRFTRLIRVVNKFNGSRQAANMTTIHADGGDALTATLSRREPTEALLRTAEDGGHR